MKVVILAGGLGTRISEETDVRPKPMVEIGGRPILWHIMKIYSSYGLNDFVVCLGYKGYVIKEYFSNYSLHMSDVTFDVANGRCEVLQNSAEPWRVTLIDTGAETMTGGRLKRVAPLLGDTFCMTYGDGVADVNIGELLKFHQAHGNKATLTATRPPARFGALTFENENLVASFEEKPLGEQSFINGGFFVLDKSVIDLIDGDDCVWERTPLERLSQARQLRAFKHEGFWQPMDTLRDKVLLQNLWQSGKAPWKVWE